LKKNQGSLKKNLGRGGGGGGGPPGGKWGWGEKKSNRPEELAERGEKNRSGRALGGNRPMKL